MAALRQSNSKNLGLADWQLLGKLFGSFGSACDNHRFEFIAGKRTVKSDSWKLPAATGYSRPNPASRLSPKQPYSKRQFLRIGVLQSGRRRHHTTGQKRKFTLAR